ncbi:MAG: hypothetical protein WCX71_04005 [Candidatus Buchananbacteria bacterium]
MSNLNHLAEKIEKHYQQRDRRKTKKMKVSGRSVINLKKIITQKAK